MKLNSAIEIRTGSDPRQRTEFIQLRDEIQKLTHPARPDINWGKVEQLSLTLFRQHGVELQTAAYYTLARTENLGLIGLEEGLAIIVRLSSQQWSVLWPQPTHARVEILAWLAERLHQVLRTLAIYYADIAVVYRLEALLAELCETLERLELKHLSKLDSLRLFMHNVAKRLEQIDGTELQQTYSSGTTPTSNDQNSAITNPTSTDSVNEQLVYIAKTDDELLFSPTLNVIVPDNVQIIEPSKPELKPGFFSRMRTPILTFIMGILIGGYGLTLAKPYWNAYQLLPLKTAILNSSTLPSSKLTSEQLELMAILPLEKREMILANIQKQHFSQSEVYLTKLNQASPLWLLQQGDTLLR
ncbi:type VI secretion system ImpA family N-terminal domain-containing protein [Thorsellia anophelis]|uniref:Type VI secretion system protein VasL n=1 Tax=Thorsellia anophelis DSM 18579 TaxID=1123402 RepID=A0A1I0FSW4_9GAMM|nr:type VI secretion system ImpA family N-terminal domain-containing protein [Thorsellia anophelis]SET61522.1 type VI secretion system protein VasL [Thorsellia anophelis DSM 18579]